MFTIQFDQPDAQYRPGDTISGSVNWKELDSKIERFEIRLIWFTEGKGTQDVEVEALSDHVVKGPSGETRFQFTTPSRPFSFSGKLISVQWTIEVVTFPGKLGQRQALTISPTGQEIMLNKSYGDEAMEIGAIVSNSKG